MGANEFDDPRVAALYDIFDSDRSDLDVYAAIAGELGARRVLDLGCGTGTLAVMLAQRGLEVVGVDPAAAMLEVARRKPGAERVRWICGDAASPALEGTEVDLVTMTGNAAQAIVDDADWHRTLQAVHDMLAPEGRLVFETREPSVRAWEAWNPTDSYAVVDGIESWGELTSAALPLVSFDSVTVFPDGTRLVASSTLRFRERSEIEADLAAHGFLVTQVRDAPDRPGREHVFFAQA